jgi:hypothetical protein
MLADAFSVPEIRPRSNRRGFGWPLTHGLTFEERTFTNQSKGDIYATLRSRIQDGTIELLDHRDSLRELRGLELENLPGGGTRIGHPRHGHDDYADAMALAVSEARGGLLPACGGLDDDDGALGLLADYDSPLYCESEAFRRR